jgi:hypothetical protein
LSSGLRLTARARPCIDRFKAAACAASASLSSGAASNSFSVSGARRTISSCCGSSGSRRTLAPRCRSRVPRRRGDQFAVRAFVFSRHSVGREAFLKAGADFSSVEPAQIAYGPDSLFLVLDDEARHAVLDDLGRGAGAVGDHWRPTGHRLDHDEADRPKAIATPTWGDVTRRSSSTYCATRASRNQIRNPCFQIHQGCCASNHPA